MATASIGQMDPFDDSAETFQLYLERFEMFALANGIEDENKKKATFLSLIGSKTYGLLRSLATPDKPKDKDFASLTKLLKDHLSPAPLEIAETYRFHQRNQQPGETVNQFIATLRSLSEHCNFGANYRTRALRDRFVCGIASDSTRRKLLSEADLTLERALELARSMEQADKDIEYMKPYIAQPVKVSSINTNETSQNANVASLSTRSDRKPCRSCQSTQLLRKDCRHLQSTCHSCGIKGHIQIACERNTNSKYKPNNRRQTQSRGTHSLDTSANEFQPKVQEQEELAHIYSLSTPRVPPIMLNTLINGRKLDMELDTGASVSTIPYSTYQRELEPTNIVLKPYGVDKKLVPQGKLTTTVQYQDQQAVLSMYVVGNESEVRLFGRDWLTQFTINWPDIKNTHHVSSDHQDSKLLDKLVAKFPSLFSDSLGEFKGFQARLNVQKDAVPTYHKHRVVPFAIRSKVEEEISSLIRENVISQVEHSEWATPVVPVIKPNGAVRLCGDFKVTLNPHLVTDTYPMPSIDDLQEKMSGGTLFSKLDLSRAFSQINITEHSKKYVTITTHLGLFQYNRLPYGISTAPAIHQRAMDRILRDVPNVLCYQDDIFITGKDYKDHQSTLETVLQRLQDHGLRVNKDKCSFLQESIVYLGHRIDRKGLHPTEGKVQAIKKAPSPRNVGELRSFLGLINYYQKFLPNLSGTLHPLHKLLNKGVPWEWSDDCQTAFNQVKDMLSTDRVLVPYDTNLPISLACDASAYGLGAVLSHVLPDGEERPIAFASRTLSVSEKNYAQIEREALALIFGVTKFHIYLYGREFKLITDHRPLTTILGPKTNIPPIAAMRMQRWAATLAAYTYQIQYRSSQENSNADAMSRLPLDCHRIHCNQLSLFYVQHFDNLPVTFSGVGEETRKDTTLSKVLQYAQKGWPNGNTDQDVEPFYQCQTELSINEGCLLRGSRLIIPQRIRNLILEELHQGHVGMTKMKQTARNYVWWPDLDRDIERMSQACEKCNSVQNKPSSITHHWAPAEVPWQRVHLDFAGPLDGQMFLLAVDAHSKWPEIFAMNSTTSSATITTLRSLFARLGLPHVVVTDNGPQFTSEEFKLFMSMNAVKHITSAPYHPQSNGLAERMVQTFKLAYKAGGGSCEQRLDRFLLKYRTTAHSTTGRSPSELIYGRKIRTRLDLLKPQKVNDHIHEPRQRRFEIGSLVWYQDYRSPSRKWRPGVVFDTIGFNMFWIRDALELQLKVRRHHDQMHHRSSHPYQQDSSQNLPQDSSVVANGPHMNYSPPPTQFETRHDTSIPTTPHPHTQPTTTVPVRDDSTMISATPIQNNSNSAAAGSEITLRRSTRSRQAPPYLQDYDTK